MGATESESEESNAQHEAGGSASQVDHQADADSGGEIDWNKPVKTDSGLRVRQDAIEHRNEEAAEDRNEAGD